MEQFFPRPRQGLMVHQKGTTLNPLFLLCHATMFPTLWTQRYEHSFVRIKTIRRTKDVRVLRIIARVNADPKGSAAVLSPRPGSIKGQDSSRRP